MKRILDIGFIIILVALIGWLVFMPMPRANQETPVMKVRLEMGQFIAAIERYRFEYGIYPLGKPSQILTTLSGRNPKQVMFLNVGEVNTNGTGEFVDPWKTPFQIDFDSTNHFTIRSAGKNKIFGDEDDFRLSNSDIR